MNNDEFDKIVFEHYKTQNIIKFLFLLKMLLKMHFQPTKINITY